MYIKITLGKTKEIKRKEKEWKIKYLFRLYGKKKIEIKNYLVA